MTAKNISKIFNKFAGREVLVDEKIHHYKGRDYTETSIASNDKVTKEIQKLAKKHLMSRVRAFLPGHFGTNDFNPHRLSYQIDKEADGKYRVRKNSFRTG